MNKLGKRIEVGERVECKRSHGVFRYGDLGTVTEVHYYPDVFSRNGKKRRASINWMKIRTSYGTEYTCGYDYYLNWRRA